MEEIKHSEEDKTPPSVFISYAHEEGLSKKVYDLAHWLNEKGIRVITDHPYVNRPPEEGWTAWMQHNVEDADVVLIVCTRKYKSLFEKRRYTGDGGMGVTYEGAVITSDMYTSFQRNHRYFPILTDDGNHSDIPAILKNFNNNHRFPSGNSRILSLIRDKIEIPVPNVNGKKIGSIDSLFSDPCRKKNISDFYGEKRNKTLIDLLENWKTAGPTTLIIQGFPGTGKTELAREVASSFPQAMPFLRPTAEGDLSAHDLLIDLAKTLDEEGFPDLSIELLKGNIGDPFRVLHQTLRKTPILIVIDEFQRIFEGTGSALPASWMEFFEKANNTPNSKGKLILVSSRMVSEERWCESCKSVVLNGLSDKESGEFLYNFLEEQQITDKVPFDRLEEIGHRLGGNPRAIKTLAAGLRSDSLDDLMSLYPDVDESDDVRVNPILLEKFERKLIERALNKVSDDILRLVRHIAVYRGAFDKSVILERGKANADGASLRQQLIDRFILSNSVFGDELHPLVREVGVSRLAENKDEWIRANDAAANYYLNKFSVSRKKGVDKIVSSYAELRYHLYHSHRIDELSKVDNRIIKLAISDIDKPEQSQVPNSSEILEERITLLSALSKNSLPKGLEFHLALCLKHRNIGNDYERALFHIRNAVGPHAYYAAWLLLIDLEYEINGIDAMRVAQRKAVRILNGEGNAFSIYLRCAQVLSKENKVDEAIKLLIEGIEMPGITCASPLISICADYMQDAGRPLEAIKLIERYLESDLPEPFILFKRCASLMFSNGQEREAVDLLKKAIDKPGMTSIYSLYLMCSDFLEKSGKTDEAISLIKEGLKNRRVKDPTELYRKVSNILVNLGRSEEAITIIESVLTDRSINNTEKIHILFSELLENIGREDEAASILKELISRTKNPTTSLYLSCAQILFRMRDIDSSAGILKDGISQHRLKNRHQLIRMYADLLYRKGEISECKDVLKQGIDDPNVDNKFALFKFYSDILVRENQFDQAIEILKTGIKAPAIENKSVLIQGCAKLLDRVGRREEAISLLKNAITQPGLTGLILLYDICAKIMSAGGARRDAIQLLQGAINGPKIGNSVSLYQLCAELMVGDGQDKKAKELLQEGIKIFPSDKNLKIHYKKLFGEKY